MFSFVSGLCTPSMIYFVISFIYLILNSFSNFNVVYIISRLIFIMLWSWLLNFLCSQGYSIISWVIILLPFFVIF